MIDQSAYPHIIEAILAHADAAGLNAFRLASRAHLAQVEGVYAERARHVVPRTVHSPPRQRQMHQMRSPPRVVFSTPSEALPALTSSDMAEVQRRTDLGTLRARYTAVRVIDVGPEIDLHTFRDLRTLLDGIHTVRLVGELRNPNHFPFAPRTVVVAADLSRPEPFRGWHYRTRELVVNYKATEGPQLLSLAFFPPSGCYGPRGLTLNFAKCDPEVLVRLPNSTRVGSRLLVDLARVVCDGHRVTLIDWSRVAALFPPGTEPGCVDDTLLTWGGPPLEPPKAARRRACFVKLAEMALQPTIASASLEPPWAEIGSPDAVHSLSSSEYAKLVGKQAYADMTENLWRDEYLPCIK